jgi:hypothetical protein
MASNRPNSADLDLIVSGLQRLPPEVRRRVESLIDLLCVSSEGAGTCAESMISNIAETCRASDENCIEDLERVIEYLMTTARAPG